MAFSTKILRDGLSHAALDLVSGNSKEEIPQPTPVPSPKAALPLP